MSRLLLCITLSAVGLCVACTSGSAPATPTDLLTPSAPAPTPESVTGIERVDRTIALLLSGDADTLAKDAVFRPVACQANPPSLSTSVEPQCAPGVEPGTPIDAFLAGECEGFYITSSADLWRGIQGRLGMGAPHSVYAVVKGGVVDSQTGRADPDIAYTIVLADGSPPAADAIASLWEITAAGELAFLNFGCGQTNENYESYFGPNPSFIYGPIAAAPTPLATLPPKND